MKTFQKAICLWGILILIWVSLSFGEVVAQNKPATGRPTYSSWNMFQMISEEG